MSLLIKALEQAAKDRKAGRVEPAEAAAPAAAQTPAAAQAPATFEPTLEPPPPPRGGATARTPPRPSDSATPVRPRAGSGAPAAAAASQASLPMDAPATPHRSATSLAGLAQIDAQQQRSRAATVMQAGGGSAANVIAFFRGNPVMMFAALAALCGVVFGIYVYLQIAKPGIFVRQAATRPQDAAPPAPPSPPAVPPVPSGLPEAPAPGGPALAGTPVPEPSPVAPGQPAPPVSGTITAPAATAPGPVPSSAVVATAPPMNLPRAQPERPPEERPERGSPRAERQSEPRAAPRAAAAAVEPAPAAGGERISVSPSGNQPRLNPQLTQAYSQLQGGNIEEARTLYTRINQAEPLNVDALLGLAYIAAQENRSEDAMKFYVRILQLNPRHAVAQGALIGLMGRADTGGSETRLKQLIAREPSAFLHFVLGNLYADQAQWPQAQQSYFQAHHLEPENPDYAYNLAVGLDHLRQSKLALNYYLRAEQLASVQGRSNFNLSHARERIRALSSQLE